MNYEEWSAQPWYKKLDWGPVVACVVLFGCFVGLAIVGSTASERVDELEKENAALKERLKCRSGK